MKKVFLSPSSQQYNLGVIPGYIEEVICNRVADAAEKVLQFHNITVIRNNPEETFKQHVQLANLSEVDVYVCIHTNAAGAGAEGLRAGCYAPEDPTRESTKLTQALFNRLTILTPSLKDIMTKYGFYEILASDAPCAYLELSFHTNRAECQWLIDNTEQIGIAIARGCLDHLGIDYIDPDPGCVYRVQVGAFSNYANAEAMKERLTAAGFSSYIRKGE